MKANSLASVLGSHLSVDTQKQVHDVVSKGILARLEREEHNRDNLLAIKSAIKAATTCLEKGIIQVEVIEKVEERLVTNTDLHQSCRFEYIKFLKDVRSKNTYDNWQPQTIDIITGKKPNTLGAGTIVSLPLISPKTVMDAALFVNNETVKHINFVEVFELDKVLADIGKLNQNNPGVIELTRKGGALDICYRNVRNAAKNDSIVFRQGEAIGKWEKEHIAKWANNILKYPEVANDVKMIPEMIAAIDRAVFLHNRQTPRTVQLASVIMTALSNDRGKLLQISTGEGKSTTTAMFAAFQALRSKNVDVITSSSVLAKRDAKEWCSFYDILGLSSAHNISEGKVTGLKECYGKNIVYGDALHFQSDTLREEYKMFGTKGGRDFKNSVALIDEVDSMLIDESGKIAKLATPIPSMEYLAPIFVTSSHYLKQMINYFKEEESSGGDALENRIPWMQENLTRYIEKLVGLGDVLDGTEQIIVPAHLQSFVEMQAPIWAKSAIGAMQMSEKRDYLIIGQEGKKVIAPVDYASTGIVQERTSWMNGLHQYLQIKHNLAMTSESLTTSFISNMAYFKRYGSQIFGMSGTLGSKHEQELLKKVYDVDLAFIPTFKPKRFNELAAIVTDGTKEWYKALVDTTRFMAQEKRATLILAETIEDVENIRQALIEGGIAEEVIHTYTTGSEAETKQVIEDTIKIGHVIVATNIAGRGTDIKTSAAVENAGGLHVCLTFLPSNLRVEEQAFGRTARQGLAGSAQLVLNGTYEALKLHNAISDQEDNVSSKDIDILRLRRDIAEQMRLTDIQKRLIPKIELEDQMFNRFSGLLHELKGREDNEYKLRQLEEHWGLWFKEISHKLDDESKGDIDSHGILNSLDEFSKDMKSRYGSHAIMQNPAYLTLEGVNKFGQGNSYDQSVALLSNASSMAGEYGFAASYNLAYSYFRQNAEHLKKNDERLVNSGAEYLNKALMQLESVVIPQLHMMQILVGSEENNSELSIQIATKLNLHKMQSSYIRNALTLIDEGLSQGKVIVVKNSDSKPIFSIVGQTPNNASEEVLELARFGNTQFFTLDAKKPPKDTLSAIGMSILGVSQFIVGALVTVCTGGAATALGASMMLSGAQDLYKGVRVGMSKETINWGEYWVNKGISYAVSIISMGWENFKSGLSAIKEQVERLAEAGKNFFTGTATTVMGRQAATQITQEGIKQSVAESTKTTFTSIAKDFIAKEGMSTVVMEVGKSIITQNITNVVAKEITERLDGTKKDVTEDAYNQIMHSLNSEPTLTYLNRLIAMDKMVGSNSYIQSVKIASAKVLNPKIDRITQLARQLSTAAISGMASRSGNVKANIGMKVAITGMQILEASNEIKHLIGEFCQELQVQIAQLDQKATSLMPKVLASHLQQWVKRKDDIDAIIEILKMHHVFDENNMRFNNELMQPLVNFEPGIAFKDPLHEPEVINPVIISGVVINKPKPQEIRAFQLEELKKNGNDEPKNIEAIDFGPFRYHRDKIIQTARYLNNTQITDYQNEKHELAEELAGKVSDRTMGIIRHSIITPVVSPVINFSTEILTTHFVNLTAKNITGVSSGDSNFLPQEHEEVLPLEINPQLNGEETDYVLKVHYRAIGFSKDEKTQEIKQSTSPGHIYYELIDVNAPKKRSFFSAYPENEDDSLIGKLYNPMDDKSHLLDEFQHKAVINHMSETGQQVLFTKVLFLTPDQFKTTSEFAKTINKNRTYVLGKNDCSDLGKELFEKIDIPTEYNFLFNKTELSQALVGTKIKIMHGNRDGMFTVKGNSREEIAAKYKVPVERVVKKYPELNTSITTLNSTKDNFIRDMEYDILPFKK